MAASRDDILDLIEKQAGKRPAIAEQEDLFGVFGIDGDDASELLEAFSAQFNVRMDGFVWYFHHQPEAAIFHRVIPVGLNGAELPTVAVTVDMLLAAAETGEWTLRYPVHTVAVRSISMRVILTVMVGALLLVLLASFIASS